MTHTRQGHHSTHSSELHLNYAFSGTKTQLSYLMLIMSLTHKVATKNHNKYQCTKNIKTSLVNKVSVDRRSSTD